MRRCYQAQVFVADRLVIELTCWDHHLEVDTSQPLPKDLASESYTASPRLKMSIRNLTRTVPTSLARRAVTPIGPIRLASTAATPAPGPSATSAQGTALSETPLRLQAIKLYKEVRHTARSGRYDRNTDVDCDSSYIAWEGTSEIPKQF